MNILFVPCFPLASLAQNIVKELWQRSCTSPPLSHLGHNALRRCMRHFLSFATYGCKLVYAVANDLIQKLPNKDGQEHMALGIWVIFVVDIVTTFPGTMMTINALLVMIIGAIIVRISQNYQGC